MKRAAAKTSAPMSWRNWRASLDGVPAQSAHELRMYSDAWFTDEALDYGPYSFLNPVPQTTASGIYALKPALALRYTHHLAGERPDYLKTDDKHYHGGWLTDEIAALASLVLGVRLQAGPTERDWGNGTGEYGRLRTHASDFEPSLPRSVRGAQIRQLARSCDLKALAQLRTFSDLPPEAAAALVKSARLYQQAIWIADGSPELSWLLLVAALETGAAQWRATVEEPATRLERSYPRLVEILRTSGHPDLLPAVARELAPLTAATTRFVTFVTTFAPEAPEVRPSFHRFEYEPKELKMAAAKIYEHRSRALHDGVPFPAPMCDPPRWYGPEPAEEKPGGLATHTMGATWVSKDVPMLLHLFVHITRGALLNWWTEVVQRDRPASSEG